MIKYIALGLLLYAQVSLAQNKADSLFSTAPNILLPEIKKPEKTLPDSSLQKGSNLTGEQPQGLLSEQPAVHSPKKIYLQPLVTPALLVGFGFLTLGNPEFLESNEGFQRVLTGQFANFHSRVDNYTRYVPLAAVYGLNLTGVKGKHGVVSLSLIFALSSFLNNTITKNLKQITKEHRPDFPSMDAFPSQHTSTAFTNAEILHQEFKDQSGWYSIGGYSFAIATGALRMLNNRHWLSDVMAGAGVGILSTRLAYFIYPWLHNTINLDRMVKDKISLLPMYQDGSYGLSLKLKVDKKQNVRKKG